IFCYVVRFVNDDDILSLHDALPIWRAQPLGQPVERMMISWPPSPTSAQSFSMRSTRPGNTRSLSASASPQVGNADWRWLRVSARSEEHTSELQSRSDLVCRLLLEKK